MFLLRRQTQNNQENDSSYQDTKVAELKTGLGPLSGRRLKYCTDACLRRYLEARNWNVDKAKKMLEETLKWRATYKPEEIRWAEIAHEGETGKVSRANFHDRLGRTVLIMRPGMQNTTSAEDNIRHLVYLLENAILNLSEGQEQMSWLCVWELLNREAKKMRIHHIACLQDNYSYLIVDESTKEAAAVDPVEPEKVLEVASSHGLTLKFVLTTHHHWDHAGGNDKIKQLVPGIKVYGGSIENVKGCTDKVENGDKVSLGAEITILALHTPCHTQGHISYYVTGKEDEQPAVFTGDTLFIASCGKFFEGTAEQMYQSLNVTLASLPKSTRVYCGHEYSVNNLQFALTLEPDNLRIQQKLTWARNQRQAGQATIPSTIEDELETNPFMRVDLPEIQERVGCKSPVEALGEIRKQKDNWRG